MRLLFLCHAHPSLQAGGTEIFSRDLFRSLCSEAENLSARPRQTPFSGCQRGFVPVVKALWRA